MPVQCIADGIVGTDRQAVEAHNAAAHVRDVVVQVDALALADVDTAPTLRAAVGVDVDVERRTPRHRPQQRPHRAECVAEQAAAPIAHGCNRPERRHRCECRETYAPRRHRLDHARIKAVGLEPSVHSRQGQYQQYGQNPEAHKAQRAPFARMAIDLMSRARARKQVHQCARRADGRAIYPAENKRNRKPKGQHRQRQRRHRRHELQHGKPMPYA